MTPMEMARKAVNYLPETDYEPILHTKEHIDRFAAILREECAKVCEEIEQDRWNLYKGRPPYTGSEAGRADPHEQGVSMGAGECAAAIRAMGEK